jgi:hypothetical protein
VAALNADIGVILKVGESATHRQQRFLYSCRALPYARSPLNHPTSGKENTMITQTQAARMLSDFEQDVERVGYETCDKRTLANLFGYLKIRCADSTFYGRADKLKAVQALEQRWQSDRKGKPILGGQNGVMGWDPEGTQQGALTIGAILREMRALLVEVPEKIKDPAPQFWPPIAIPGTVATAAIVDAVNSAVAKALAERDAQQRETFSA